jgi:uncharacterized membrane protein YfcA
MDLSIVNGDVLSLLVAVGVAALLYSSSGHGGGTAYLALFALWGVAPATMRPLALVLNVVVAGIGAARLLREGVVPRRTVLWLLLGSVPAAFIGALATVSTQTYRAVLGGLLLLAAARVLMPTATAGPLRQAPALALVAMGAGLGALSGMTGIGGGIFLSPLLLLLRLEPPRATAGAAAGFIVVNSLVGLNALAMRPGGVLLPAMLPLFVVVVAVGGLVGSWAVARRLDPRRLLIVLSMVLGLSGVRLISEAMS